VGALERHFWSIYRLTSGARTGIDLLSTSAQYEVMTICLLTSMRATTTANRGAGTDD